MAHVREKRTLRFIGNFGGLFGTLQFFLNCFIFGNIARDDNETLHSMIGAELRNKGNTQYLLPTPASRITLIGHNLSSQCAIDVQLIGWVTIFSQNFSES